MAPSRSWYRRPEIFVDHPRYNSSVQMKPEDRPPEVWANAKKDKIKVYCRPCLDAQVGEIMLEDDARVERGEQGHCRTRDEIILWLFNRTGAEHKYLEARSETLLQHLKNCHRQPSSLREQAAQDLEERKHKKLNKDVQRTPTATRTYSYSNTVIGVPNTQAPYHASVPHVVSPHPIRHYAPAPLLHYQNQSSHLSMHEQAELQQRFSAGAEMPVPYLDTSAPVPGPSRSNESNFIPRANATYPPNMVHHWDTTVDPFLGRPHSSTSFSRTDTPSVDSSSQSAYSYHNKRSRTSGAFAEKRTVSQRQSYSDLNAPRPTPPPPTPAAVPVWQQAQQDDFTISLARVIASGDLALSVVENPELINLFQKYLPYAKIPSRKTMTQTVIPRLLDHFRDATRASASGQLLTIQCDGWTGKNFIHLVAFMASSAQDMFTVKVFDTTIDRKTAKNLLVLIEKIMVILKEWGSDVTSVVSDASGEAARARRLLREKYPELVVPDCAAHQINLMVGDYFRNAIWLFVWTGKANDLITWLRSKTAILGLIRQAFIQQGKRPLSVIRPVPTRWTAFYLAYDRLIKLKPTLEWIIANDKDKPAEERQIIQPEHERSAREKALKMVEIIQTHEFWVSLTRAVTHLRPLAIAANVTQAKHARLDQVFVTFGKLVLEYQSLGDDDREVKHALISSINRRWGKSDKDVLVAALFLNPYYKISLFRITPERTSIAAMHMLLSRLWKRFYKEDPPPGLYHNVSDYIEGKQIFQFVDTVCEMRRRDAAAKNNTTLDPFQVYHDIGSFQSPRREDLAPLVRLAQRILSICANSASCERLFSTFGLIMTKLRTRLTTENLVNLAELKMYIRDEHARDKDLQNATRQRFFGHRQNENELPSTPQPFGGSSNTASLTGYTDGGIDTVDADRQVPSDDDCDSSGPPRGLRAIAARLSRLASDDKIGQVDDDSDDDVIRPAASARLSASRAAPPTSSAASGPSLRAEQELPDFRNITIAEIFDFTRPGWLGIKQRSAVLGLERELEMYDLLDLDAPGDLDPDIDDSIADFVGM